MPLVSSCFMLETRKKLTMHCGLLFYAYSNAGVSRMVHWILKKSYARKTAEAHYIWVLHIVNKQYGRLSDFVAETRLKSAKEINS